MGGFEWHAHTFSAITATTQPATSCAALADDRPHMDCVLNTSVAGRTSVPTPSTAKASTVGARSPQYRTNGPVTPSTVTRSALRESRWAARMNSLVGRANENEHSSIFIATPIMFWWYKGKRPDFEDETKKAEQ